MLSTAGIASFLPRRLPVYKESNKQINEGIVEWSAFKQTRLPQLNQQLREGSLVAIAISEIEQEIQLLVSR